MRPWLARLAAVGALVGLVGAAAGDAFVGGVEDIPLMPGLVEDAAATLVFDSAEGRIVEARAHGALRRAEVRDFYATALAELGWRRAGDLVYLREGERLAITIAGTDGDLEVGFALGPASP